MHEHMANYRGVKLNKAKCLNLQFKLGQCPLGIASYCETASSDTQCLPELQRYSVVNCQQ